MISSNKELYRQIFKIIYLSMINGLITEFRYIDILQKLTMKGFKTYHILDIEKLIIYMYNIGINDSFNITLLIHFRDINYKTLSEIAQNINDIRIIFSLKKKSMIDRIQEIIILIKTKMDIIKSFKKIENYEVIHNTLNYNIYKGRDNCHLSNERIKNEWDYYLRSDIMFRLHLLIQKHYDIEELKYMNVELKLLSELNKMCCAELLVYYNNVIRTIEAVLKEWITVCKIFVDIEIDYLKCCKHIIANEPVKLALENFSINITE